MATLAEKLQLTLDTKNAIKEALEEKGVDMSDKKFRDYPDAINEMKTSGGFFTSPFDMAINASDNIDEAVNYLYHTILQIFNLYDSSIIYEFNTSFVFSLEYGDFWFNDYSAITEGCDIEYADDETYFCLSNGIKISVRDLRNNINKPVIYKDGNYYIHNFIYVDKEPGGMPS